MASRTFQSGATREKDEGKIDPEAALSPLVLIAYCEYVRKHRLQSDGKLRGDDNWQLGIPIASYMKSLLRHVLEAWRAYRQKEDINDALFAIMFNTMGLLHEKLSATSTQKPPLLSWPPVLGRPASMIGSSQDEIDAADD